MHTRPWPPSNLAASPDRWLQFRENGIAQKKKKRKKSNAKLVFSAFFSPSQLAKIPPADI